MIQNIIFSQNIEMIKDFVLQLKDLHKDRAQFQSITFKASLKKSLHSQEDKYQAYIIEQMASQNRIIAASHFAFILDTPLRELKSEFLSKAKINAKGPQSIEIETNQERGSQIGSKGEDTSNSIRVDMVLLKMCTKKIFQQAQRTLVSAKLSAFESLLKFSERSKKIERVTKLLRRYSLRHGMSSLKSVMVKSDGLQDQLFSGEFSMIEKKSRMRKCNPDESYLSLVLDKENANLDCHKCRQNSKATTQKDREIAKMKEELSFLKNLLTEKNLQLKGIQEQLDQLIMRSSEDSQLSASFSKNSSYYSQAQRQILGAKRPRKTGSIASNTSNLPKEEISKELLGKFMRQSFQLKQSMDVAREICQSMETSIPIALRSKLQQLLAVLGQGEEVSLVDQY